MQSLPWSSTTMMADFVWSRIINLIDQQKSNFVGNLIFNVTSVIILLNVVGLCKLILQYTQL